MPVEKKYLHDIDLVNNRLLNPIINPLTTVQRTTLAGVLTVLDEGYLAYDTTASSFYYWDGTAWQQVGTGGGGSWGSITGIITNQTDLINYLVANYYPLVANPANYIIDAPSDGNTYGRNNGLWVTVGGGPGLTRNRSNVAGTVPVASAAGTDYYYFCTAAATLNMPTAVGNSNEYTIKRTGAGTVTVNAASGEFIDGSVSINLNVVNQSVTLFSDGANWQII